MDADANVENAMSSGEAEGRLRGAGLSLLQGGNGQQAVRHPGWRERLALWLFPQCWPTPPSTLEEPGWAPGEGSIDCFIIMGWQDRLRILVSGKAVARIRVKTDVPIQAVKVRSSFSVLPAWKWER